MHADGKSTLASVSVISVIDFRAEIEVACINLLNRPILSCINLTQNLLFKAFINLDLIFRQNLFPKLVMAQDNARFRIENSIQTFDAFVRCTLIGNQPWPQFQTGIR